jgi:hypothetical protein
MILAILFMPFVLFFLNTFKLFVFPVLWPSIPKDLYSRKDMNLARFNIDCMQAWNSSDRAGRKSQGPAILPNMPVQVSVKIFCLCILFCTGNRKCNWYAGTISQLGIRFCFKWHLLHKHATVSMVILLIIVFL